MTYQFDQVHIDNGKFRVSKAGVKPKTLGEGEEKIKQLSLLSSKSSN